MKQEDPINKFLENNIGTLIIIAIIVIFGGYLVYSFYFSGPMPDCGYTDTGCQGDTKFGQ